MIGEKSLDSFGNLMEMMAFSSRKIDVLIIHRPTFAYYFTVLTNFLV